MSDQIDRRRFLAGVGATAVTAGLAGCTGNGGAGSGGTDTPAPTSGGGDGGGGGGSDVSDEARGRIEEYVDPSENFDGTIVDATGRDEVVVDVGARGNGGSFAFAPPAVAISAGTTVSWQWTGEGGQHNVVSTDSSDFDFDSGDPRTDGDPFEQSFDAAGVGLYLCEPHESLHMKGAVVGVEQDTPRVRTPDPVLLAFARVPCCRGSVGVVAAWAAPVGSAVDGATAVTWVHTAPPDGRPASWRGAKGAVSRAVRGPCGSVAVSHEPR